jgi:hypothetical protein
MAFSVSPAWRRARAFWTASQAERPKAPLIASYVDTIEPLPLSSPSSSRDPISISASPVEIA